MGKNNKSNKGYTLVEMLIVIAIIAVMASMSVVSITIVNAARAKDAAIQFDTSLATLITKSKNMKPNYTNGSFVATDFCMIMYKDADGNVCYADAYYDSSTGTTMCEASDVVTLSTRVDANYVGTFNGTTYDESVSLPVVTSAIVIRYDKRGNCVSGDGDYLFKKRSGNKVAHVLVRKNGSHVSR